METSEWQIKSIEGAASRLSVNDDDRQPVAAIRRAVGRGRRQPTTPRQPSSSATCRYCGGQYCFLTQVAAPPVLRMERCATVAYTAACYFRYAAATGSSQQDARRSAGSDRAIRDNALYLYSQ